jgi:hypothetical protein
VLAHWQMKATLRGEETPFDGDTLSILVDGVGMNTQKVRGLAAGGCPLAICIPLGSCFMCDEAKDA